VKNCWFWHTERMARQADVTALVNLIEQAYLINSEFPMPPGDQESARENLKAALVLAKLLQQENKSAVS
jgi:hypothetical protein